jgi:hypothetical protein
MARKSFRHECSQRAAQRHQYCRKSGSARHRNLTATLQDDVGCWPIATWASKTHVGRFQGIADVAGPTAAPPPSRLTQLGHRQFKIAAVQPGPFADRFRGC